MASDEVCSDGPFWIESNDTGGFELVSAEVAGLMGPYATASDAFEAGIRTLEANRDAINASLRWSRRELRRLRLAPTPEAGHTGEEAEEKRDDD
jgi:Arc/MetJ-type ribon-helix-helix transcriptional regulator